MSVHLSWESLPLSGGLSSRSQSASPCSTSPQNTLSQPLPTITHKKAPKRKQTTIAILPPILEKQLQIYFVLTLDHIVSQFPYHHFYHSQEILNILILGGSLFHSQNLTYQVKNELCLLAFQTCKLPQPT